MERNSTFSGKGTFPPLTFFRASDSCFILDYMRVNKFSYYYYYYYYYIHSVRCLEVSSPVNWNEILPLEAPTDVITEQRNSTLAVDTITSATVRKWPVPCLLYLTFVVVTVQLSKSFPVASKHFFLTYPSIRRRLSCP